MYVINFLLSVIPLDFLQTWVYVKNNRSMLATIIFHLFINIMQEKINMTPETKCIQTIYVVIATIIKYSLQGTTQGRYLTGGVPPVRFSM